MKKIFSFLFGLFILGGSVGVFADDLAPDVRTDIIAESIQAKPGDTVLIGVHFHIQELWHIYWKNAGDAGIPTTVQWTLPAGVTVSELRWPEPHVFDEEGDIRTAGYKNETVLLAALTLPAHWPANKPIAIKADVKWLVCKVACIPGGSTLTKQIRVGSEQIVNKQEAAVLQKFLQKVPTAEVEEKIAASLKSSATGPGAMGFGLALLFAFLGGLLLNLMPCVLPVLSIKVFRLVKHQDAPQRQLIGESLLYGAGVLLSFAVLAGMVVFLKSIGQEIGWGFQFQEPRFVIALTAVLFISALAFMNFFEFSLLLPSSLTRRVQQGGAAGALWDGFLATLLATPCTAPFLGAALGFSFSQPAPVIFLFFLVIGVGLALPYVLFAAAPKATAFLPKPGTWMETFKELMGFPLLATAIWLLWILGQQRGSGAVTGALIFLLSISLALWGTKRWRSLLTRLLFFVFVVVAYVFGVERSLEGMPAAATDRVGSTWKPFSTEALNEQLAQGKTVFVDFTADWCLTCQLNKRVLHSQATMKAFQESGVVLMLADWTSRSEEITQTLRKLGRSGVPVYVIYSKDKKPVVLPELLTEKIVFEALQKTK